MQGKIMFNKSGSGSINAKLAIPKVFLEMLKITPQNRNINIELVEDSIYITRCGDKLVTFNKMQNSISGKITIPAELIRTLNITEDNREVNITLEGGSIIIKPVKGRFYELQQTFQP